MHPCRFRRRRAPSRTTKKGSKMITVGVRRSRRLGRGGMRRVAPLAAVATAGVMLLSACGGGFGPGGTPQAPAVLVSPGPGEGAGREKEGGAEQKGKRGQHQPR